MSRPVRNRRLYDSEAINVGNPTDKVGKKIKKLKREGKDQDQAVAIALSMKRRGEL